MIFSKAVKEDGRMRNRQTSRQEEENSNEETEVVCMSPGSGELHTTRINLEKGETESRRRGHK